MILHNNKISPAAHNYLQLCRHDVTRNNMYSPCNDEKPPALSAGWIIHRVLVIIQADYVYWGT